MALEIVEAKTQVEGEDGSKVEVNASGMYDFGDSLDDASQKFTDKVVFDLYKAQAKIVVQALIRRCLVAKMAAEEIEKKVAEYILGTSLTVQKNTQVAMLEEFKSMTREEQDAYISRLRETIQ